MLTMNGGVWLWEQPVVKSYEKSEKDKAEWIQFPFVKCLYTSLTQDKFCNPMIFNVFSDAFRYHHNPHSANHLFAATGSEWCFAFACQF